MDRKNRGSGYGKSCKHVKTSSGRDPSLRGPVGQRPQDFTTLLKEDPSVESTLPPLEIRRDYPRFLSKLCDRDYLTKIILACFGFAWASGYR